MNKKEKGITLISLVITIIVLLILAGITITMLAGQDSILRQAAKAKKEIEEQTEIEGVKFATTTAILNEDYKIKDKESLQQELNKTFTNASVTGSMEKGYEVTIGNNVYKVSATGEVVKQEPEILEGDIWNVALIEYDGNYINPMTIIKLKSKYKKISLQEYKDSYLKNAVIEHGTAPYTSTEADLDDFMVGMLKAWGIPGASMEEVLECFKEQGQEMTREQLVYGLNWMVTTVDEALKECGYTDEDIARIEQEYAELNQPEEIPESIKNKTYTITYPNGNTKQIKGDELDTFSLCVSPKGNGCNQLKISDGEKEVILQVNVDNYCRDIYEDEYYQYVWQGDEGLGYAVMVKDKTLSQYGKILEEIDGVQIVDMRNTFKDCTNLVQAPDIPSSVIAISGIFTRCTNLSGVLKIYCTELNVYNSAFSNAATNGTGLKVVVPNESARNKLSSDLTYDKTKIQFVASENQ